MRIPAGVKEFQDLEDGFYLTQIERVEEKANEADGRYYIQAGFRVVEPAERAGMIRNEKFWIGTLEDPGAQQAATWIDSISAKKLKGLCTKVGVGFDDQDSEVVFGNLLGQNVMIEIETTMSKAKVDPGTGQVLKEAKKYSNIRRYHAPGERTPVILGQQDQGQPQAAQRPPVPTVPPAPAPVSQPQQRYVQPAAPPLVPQAGGNGNMPPVPPAPPAYPQGTVVPGNPPPPPGYPIPGQ